MQSLLFVLKDMGSANMAGPLIQHLSSQFEIIVVTEDKARDGLKNKFGITPNYDASVESVDPAHFLEMLEPHAVLVGVGSPINLELAFLRETLKRGIPTIALEDFHGGHKRLSQTVPDLLLVLDEYASEIAKNNNASKRIAVVGNPGIHTSMPSAETENIFHTLRDSFGSVYTFSSSGTFDDLILTVACMEKSAGCLIPRLHPKYCGRLIPDGSGETYDERWNGILSPLGERVIFLPHITTEDTTILSDGTFSGHSILMYTAAWHGRHVFALDTPEVRHSLVSQSHMEFVPITKLGITHSISEPTDVGLLQPIQCKRVLFPYDEKVATEAVLSLLANHSKVFDKKD